MMTDPYSMIVFGDGWRGRFLCRIAKAVPDKLQVRLVVGHHADRLAAIEQDYGVVTTTDADAVNAAAADFAAVAVSWSATPGLVARLAEQGRYVYCETPPAPDMEGLRALWTRIAGRAELVQVGEQYYRMPGHASRLALVRSGVIGTPNSVEVASTHLYHAVALIRDYLGIGLEPVVVNARSFTAPMLDPLHFDGWDTDPQPKPLETQIATIDFGDGRYGLYNFVDNQWWNPLLSRRIVVRGSFGEIADDAVMRFNDGVPMLSRIEYRRLGRDMNLEGNEVATVSFDGELIWRNPCPGAYLSEDDLAVADHLIAMGRYARGEGPEIYPLAAGIHDHAIGLAIGESARVHADVRVSGELWMSAR